MAVSNSYLEAPPVLPLLVALGILGVQADQEAPAHLLPQLGLALDLAHQDHLSSMSNSEKINMNSGRNENEFRKNIHSPGRPGSPGSPRRPGTPGLPG